MGRLIDISGKRFGRLTALRRVGISSPVDRQALWECRCDCGAIRRVRSKCLRSGNTQSCGCFKADMVRARTRKIIPVGTRYANLTVMENLPPKKWKSWLKLQCDCGKIIKVDAAAVWTGHRKWCGPGCPFRSPDAARKKLLRRYKYGAKGRQLQWGLSEEDFFSMVVGECHYCGSLRESTLRASGRNPAVFRYTGIDRKDSRKGYYKENCISCCAVCNEAKMCRSYDEFVAWVFQTSAHLKGSQ